MVSPDTRVQLEMGGKNPIVVLEDADLEGGDADRARRLRADRTGLHRHQPRARARPVHDALVERIAAAAGKFKVGPGTEEGVQMGPLATRGQYDKVLSYIAIARDEGARIAVGGEALRGNGDARLA